MKQNSTLPLCQLRISKSDLEAVRYAASTTNEGIVALKESISLSGKAEKALMALAQRYATMSQDKLDSVCRMLESDDKWRVERDFSGKIKQLVFTPFKKHSIDRFLDWAGFMISGPDLLIKFTETAVMAETITSLDFVGYSLPVRRVITFARSY